VIFEKEKCPGGGTPGHLKEKRWNKRNALAHISSFFIIPHKKPKVKRFSLCPVWVGKGTSLSAKRRYRI
jgi:hypothetical protein